MLRSINPATEVIFAEYAAHAAGEIDRRLGLATRAFESWRLEPIDRRAARMRSLATILRGRRPMLAALMTAEVGKTIGASEAEVDKCAGACEFFADHAPRMLADRAVATDAKDSFIRLDPLGPVLAIMPWNFPLWQVFRFAAPALMAGNVGVLKHATNVTGCALAIESAFGDAGFPEGAFVALLVDDDAVAQSLVARPTIRAVTLTGSERAGRAVAAAAATVLKKSVLELGGSDAFIVLADADVASVAEAAADARCLNNGQSCIAAKRFIVVAAVAEAFEAAFVAAMSRRVVGDPTDRATQVGPLARDDLRGALDDQVRRSIEAGARLACGGARPEGRGYFYPPTVLLNVRPGIAAFDEETFGPVAAVVRARDVVDAIALANRSRYGLGASVWTADLDAARAIAARLEAGSVFVNAGVRSDPRLPFGGVKDSGWGRELSHYGVEEFCNVKSVWIDAPLKS